MNFCLLWVFVAVLGLPLVAARKGFLWLRQGRATCHSGGTLGRGLSDCGAGAYLLLACLILLDQAWNRCPQSWQVAS